MLNLHNIVRGAVTYNHPDVGFTLYRANEPTFDHGIKVVRYTKIDGVVGNFQSEGDASLNFSDNVVKNTYVRKLYVYADANMSPWAMYRPLARGGDYLQDAEGMYWAITAVLEDFREVGWVSLRCVLQQGVVNLNVEED